MNGTEVQNGNTRDMIFSVPAIIALISQTLTLHPGDVIATGTPEGVGYARTPQWLLQPGDTVEVEIDTAGHPHHARRRRRHSGPGLMTTVNNAALEDLPDRGAGPDRRRRTQRAVPRPGPRRTAASPASSSNRGPP